MRTNIVDSLIQTPVESNLLKYAAGQAMFCPHCQQIMDWRKTVVATIHATYPSKEEKCVKSYVVCSSCWDNRGHIVQEGVDKANSNLAGKGIVARVEIVDGRDDRFNDLD